MADRETAWESLRSKRRLQISLTLLAIFTVLVVWDLKPYFEYEEKANRIRQLIPIGSNIDDAGPVLRKNGFTFHEKHFSNIAEDTYSAHKKQVLTYLRLTGMKRGCLLNFGEALMKDGINRIVCGKL